MLSDFFFNVVRFCGWLFVEVKSGEYFSYHIPGIINHIVKLGVGIELCDGHYWHHETADFIFVAAENGVRLIY